MRAARQPHRRARHRRDPGADRPRRPAQHGHQPGRRLSPACPKICPRHALRACRHVHITAWSLFTDPPRAAALRAAQIAKAGRRDCLVRPGHLPDDPRAGPRQVRAHHRRSAGRYPVPQPRRGPGADRRARAAAIAQELHERYAGAIIALKLDRDGCYVLADGHAQAYPTGDGPVVDATGAGDAFDAAFMARYARDGDLAAAARFANTIASWVVARYGARPPTDEELAAIIREVQS